MIEVVYRPIKTKQFRGKDALKRAKQFAKELRAKRMVDEVELFDIDSSGGANGVHFIKKGGKWYYIEMDG